MRVPEKEHEWESSTVRALVPDVHQVPQGNGAYISGLAIV